MAPRAVVQNITLELPRRLPKVFRTSVSEAIEAHLQAVTLLTAVLDRADGDTDLEPSLGVAPDKSANIDLEGDTSDDELTGDESEPDLGWAGDVNQVRAQANAQGSVFLPHSQVWINRANGGEAEHDGREPSLGSTAAAMHDQTRWAAGGRDDREHDDEREP